MTQTTRKRAEWSEESREAARQRANALIAQGKFGGRAGRGGRPKKRAPGEAELLALLREQSRLSRPFPRQVDALQSLAIVAGFASQLPLDREHLSSLLLMGLQRLVNDGHLAALAEVHGEEVRLHHPKSGEAKKRLRLALEEKGDVRFVMPADLTLNDVAKFTDSTLVESLGLVASLTTRELLHDAINDALHQLVAGALRAVSDPVVAGT
jgi:hypothetical protein